MIWTPAKRFPSVSCSARAIAIPPIPSAVISAVMSPHHAHDSDHRGAEHDDHEHASSRAHQQRVQSAHVERKVETTGDQPDGPHPTDGTDEHVVPLEAGPFGQLVYPPDDDELQQDAQHEAAEDETEALNPWIIEEFGHDAMSAIRSISTATFLGKAPASTVTRAGR